MAHQSLFTGYKLGSNDAPNCIEMYLDFTNVMAMIEKEFPRKVQLMFRHQVQSWHPQATCLHESAIAIHKLNPNKFFAFCHILFKHQEQFFDHKTYNSMSRKQIYESIAEICLNDPEFLNVVRDSFSVDKNGEKIVTESVDKQKFLDLLAFNPDNGLNAGNSTTNDFKVHLKISRQNSIHVSPTMVWNGLVEQTYGSSWTVDQWKDYIRQKI